MIPVSRQHPHQTKTRHGSGGNHGIAPPRKNAAEAAGLNLPERVADGVR